MAINTPNDIIKFALKVAGITGTGVTPKPEDVNDMFNDLNMMLAVWNRERFMEFNELDIGITATGQTSYTIGPNGDFNTPRPDQLQSAYLRILNDPNPSNQNIDIPLSIIYSHEDYGLIGQKELQTISNAVFYDSAFPLGNLYFVPIPQGGNLYEVHVILKNSLGTFPSLTTPISLPPEYLNAIYWNLAKRALPRYGRASNSEIDFQASAGKDAVRGANTQLRMLRMPAGVPGMRAGGMYPWNASQVQGPYWG